MASILFFTACLISKSLSRLKRIPPNILGCNVFTRPSNISGNPVIELISVTSILFSERTFAVLPVAII